MHWYDQLTWIASLAMFLIGLAVYYTYSSEFGFSLFAAILTGALTLVSLIVVGWFIKALLPPK